MNIKTVFNRCARIAVATMALCCLNGCAPVLLAVYCLPYNTYQRLHEKKVDFNGRLIDQNGQPVAQAKVQYCIEGYGLAKPAPRRKFGEVVSNDDGYFDIHGGRGCELFIDKMEKRGYEFRRGEQKTSFAGVNIHLGEHEVAKELVVFHLRKKHAEAVVLLKSRASILLSTPKNISWFGWDIASCCEWTAPATPDPGYFRDYEVTGEHDAEKKEWTLTIRMNGEQAGVLVSDKLLYEAPADGYAKEVTLTLKYSDKPPLKHLYLRLRDCGMYARLDVEHGYVSENGVFFSCNVLVNPYGSRSLEPLFSTKQEGSSALFVQCRNEADRAMEQQRLAPRPPFEQWIEEGKALY
ncbi:MAG: hypothetical protein IKX30_00885 [Victivallales bacterium]|nr:hypothetical protein [Victivallales bacterium]